MKKDFLRRKLQVNTADPNWEREIDRSMDLGKSLSVGPRYTFYNSRETGCRYLPNAELTRVYPLVQVGRYGKAHLVFECMGNRKLKIPGYADLLQIREAYDTVCPRVLTGLEGREMGAEQLRLFYRKRRELFCVLALSLFCWTLACLAGAQISLRWNLWLGLGLVISASLSEICLSIWMIRILGKYQK